MPARTKKRTLAAEDLYRFQIVTDCRISPDGEQVVLAVQRVDRKTEKKYSNLWVVPVPGGEAGQFTWGDQTDTRPRWSPDGAQIAFLSNRAEEQQPQLHILPFHGGEGRPLPSLQGEFGEFSWSPDGRKILCTFRKKDARVVEREKDEQKKELGIVDRHITRTFYKLDGYGYLPRERWHLWVIDARTGRARQLTDGPIHDESSPRWSPDGEQIAFLSNRAEDPDLDPGAVDLFLIPAKGGEARKIDTPVGSKSTPSFSPDGTSIAYVANRGRGDWWQNSDLWIASTDNSTKPKNLTGKFDFTVANLTLGDISGLAATETPVWSREGDRLYFQLSRHGSTLLYSVAAGGRRQSLRAEIDVPGMVGPFSFDREQTRLAYFHADLSDPGQVWLRDLERGGKRPHPHSGHPQPAGPALRPGAGGTALRRSQESGGRQRTRPLPRRAPRPVARRAHRPANRPPESHPPLVRPLPEVKLLLKYLRLYGFGIAADFCDHSPLSARAGGPTLESSAIRGDRASSDRAQNPFYDAFAHSPASCGCLQMD